MRDRLAPDIQYVRDLFAKEDPLLQEIARRLEEMRLAIQIGPDEGKLLQLFIRMKNIRTVVELGTLGGYSAIWMARALPENGKVITIERDQENYELAEEYISRSNVASKIEQRLGEAKDILAILEKDGPYDMLFIDADKVSYPHYLTWGEKNIRKGGLIVGDNCFLFGTVYQEERPSSVTQKTWEAMREFNKRLSDPQKFFATMIPTQEGMMVAEVVG